MAKAKWMLTVGHDPAVTVELGRPEDPILVDGREIGYQYAYARCSVERAMRLVVEKIHGRIAETAEEREHAAQIAWDEDVAYERADDGVPCECAEAG